MVVLFSVGKCHVEWTTADSILLALTIIGSCILTITACAVWYPYTLTADFYPGQCRVTNVTDFGAARCSRSSSGHCPAGSPAPASSPAISNPGASRMRGRWPSRPPMSEPSTATTTQSSMTSLSGEFGQSTATKPLNVSGLCGWFPCVRVSAKYAVTSYSHMYMGVGLLHPDYDQYITLPQCSYTACDGSTYEENAAVIRQSVSQWIDALLDQHTFDCYASTDQIIIDRKYGFSAGFNSIFWPLMFSSSCLLSLLVHLAWNNSPVRRRKRTAATRRSSSRRSDVDGDVRPNLHRRNNMVATGANGLPSICRDDESFTAEGAEGWSGDTSSCSWKHDYGAPNNDGEVDMSVVWTTNVDGLFHATAPPAYVAQYDYPPPPVEGDDDLQTADLFVPPPPPYPVAVTDGNRPSWQVDLYSGGGCALPSADDVDDDVLHRRSV